MNAAWLGEQSLLPEELRDRVLVGLGFSTLPDPTFENLCRLYAAWCQNVPFDNVRKLIHVRAGKAGPLPGSTATDFLEGWLKHGTGGTCWAGAGAFHAVLTTLDFDAIRGIGTMLASPASTSNHGTVAVSFGTNLYLVDCSMLHGYPLLLRDNLETCVAHPTWGVRSSMREGHWHIRWRPLNRLEGFECRLDRFRASQEELYEFHSRTRGWSPFNYEANARINRGERVIGIAFGNGVTLENDGHAFQRPLSFAERKRVLIEDIGISEELVQRLPEDIPTPPPPGSHKAREQMLPS